MSVPRGAQCPRVDGVRIHRVTRRAGEAAGGGLPRTRVEVAALRGAAWATSDRQAALVLCMVVQQRLTTGARLLSALPVVRNRGRRPFVRQVLRDITDGAQSLGELDFAAMCRRHGIPPPDRQVLRRTALGASTSTRGGTAAGSSSRSTAPGTGWGSPSPTTTCARTRSRSATTACCASTSSASGARGGVHAAGAPSRPRLP